jgi:hypothetical protein
LLELRAARLFQKGAIVAGLNMDENPSPSERPGLQTELEEVKGRLRERAESLSEQQILELADLLHDIIRTRRERRYETR